MALPKVEVPTYELEVPSTDEKLKYRPFLVKEEKILLMALESQDNAEMMIALKEIVKACTFEKFDTDKAPLFDLEYIFLRLRAKSVGEISKFKVICPDDKTTYTDIEIDLTKSEVNKLRRLIGLKTQRRADVVLKSFIKMIVKDPDALEIIQYKQGKSTRFKQEKVINDFWNTTKQEEDYLRTRASDLDCKSKSFSLSSRFLILLLILISDESPTYCTYHGRW